MQDDSLTPWVFGGLLFAVGVGVLTRLDKTACQPITNKDRLLIFGDSLAVGLSPPMKAIGKANGVSVASLSKGGTNTRHWAPGGSLHASMLSMLETTSPSIVIFSLGTNDAADSRSIEEVRSNVQKISDVIRAHGARPIWIIAPVMPFGRPDAEAIKASGETFFDSQPISIPRIPDKIHPTGWGYSAWSEWIWGKLVCGKKPAGTDQGTGNVEFDFLKRRDKPPGAGRSSSLPTAERLTLLRPARVRRRIRTPARIPPTKSQPPT